MKHLKWIGPIIAVVAILILAPAAFAIPDFECVEDFNLEDCVPEGGILVIDVTQDVVNDIDSGVFGGYWAYDYYTRHIRVWEFLDGDPLAVVTYNGTFVTVEGPSPNNTGEVGDGVTGTMIGGYIAWFEARYLDVPAWPTEGYVGLFDYEGNTETGEVPGYVNWLSQYFSDYWDFEYLWWGWFYNACANGWWINSSEGNEGDITGDPTGPCPPPAPVLNRYHPQVVDSVWAPEGQDMVGVWVYSANHWGDQFEFTEVTHDGGGVAFIGAPDGDYYAIYRWCRDGQIREYRDDFSFPDTDGDDIVGPLIDLSEVEYEVVGSC